MHFLKLWPHDSTAHCGPWQTEGQCSRRKGGSSLAQRDMSLSHETLRAPLTEKTGGGLYHFLSSQAQDG